MKTHNRHFLLPAVLFVGSFLTLVAVMLLSNPLDNVSYAILFFAILLILLFSLGHLLVGLSGRRAGRKARSRIVIISVLVVILLMFRSTGSLNWIDLVVVALLGLGLLFYSGRRS
ncbi:MAG TPA: hypothetical protein VJY84_02840 [Candidatus Saccharimonadales bacterium]|nr:hypothetical protein [Candidatus Saccharimonadales bacterium]